MEKELSILLKENEKNIRKIAPKYVNVNRMLSLAVQAVSKNPLLRQCTAISVVDFCMKCAEAGTDRIGAGGMWAVPFRDSKTGKYIMTAIPDWRLIVEKARQAGVIKYASAELVYKDDVFQIEKGTNPSLIHKPALKERKDENIIAVYCIYILPDDTKDFVVMTRDEIDRIKNRSKAKGETSPWNTDYGEMAKKTVIKRALKIFEGASIEISKLLEIDNEAIGYEDVAFEPFIIPQELPSTEQQQENETPNMTSDDIFGIKCESCGKSINKTVAEFSQRKFNKVLCRDCQKQ